MLHISIRDDAICARVHTISRSKWGRFETYTIILEKEWNYAEEILLIIKKKKRGKRGNLRSNPFFQYIFLD